MRSFPELFQERMQIILPEGEWDSFAEHSTAPLPRTIRWVGNEMPKGWDFKPVPEIPTVGFLDRTDQKDLPLGRTPEHFCGKLYAATLSSLLSVQVLDPKPGQTVLDMCAAPGSKTSFIAHKMENTGLLVANEMDGKRLKKLTHNLNRMGVINTVVTQYDGSHLARYIDEAFDTILVDAPCSSEGFGRKQSDFFETTWDIAHAYEMAKIQKKLIVAAFHMLKPGGEMVYSTCTAAPEENEMVVQHLVDLYGDKLELLDIDLGSIPHHEGIKEWDNRTIDQNICSKVKRLFPHLHTDTWDSETFFICKIRKTASTPEVDPDALSSKHAINNPPLYLKKQQAQNIFKQVEKDWGIVLDPEQYALVKHSSGHILLTTPEAAEFCTRFPHRDVGTLLMTKDSNPGNEFAMNFGHLSDNNQVEITRDQVDAWLKGQDIPLENALDRSVLFPVCGDLCLGWGKPLPNGKLKNKVPRGLVV